MIKKSFDAKLTQKSKVLDEHKLQWSCLVTIFVQYFDFDFSWKLKVSLMTPP